MKKELMYWDEKHLEDLEKVQTYSSLKEIVLKILSGIPQPIGEVCGPITSGGENSIEENLKNMERIILKLGEQEGCDF